ncbi:FAD:protein FMN transferase [Bifidobacterium longum]|uniref:FAD:protein FMN transferase n=1 Tax=Bifidobacterium longum TaxID=216816 RepID=UPI0008F92540|nr:FAD:protein FMN transferase [Bifidobacterium longum]OIN64958.1 thiamine biosynthesis protein ApbE [Bifidobacterium longum subsp. infantis]
MTGPTQRPHDRPHVRLTDRLPHVAAFPEALGTGLLLHTDVALDDGLHDRLGAFIDTYERTLSRFRDDSTVSRMRTAARGGVFDFPDWASGLFDLYDALYSGTDGAIDPCVGEDLIRLGYDAVYSFTVEPDARGGRLGAIHGRPTWGGDVERHGATLVTRRPVALDFGACGKGYLADLLAGMLGDGAGHPQPIQYVIDAGGDLLVHTDEPITIALEDPADPANAVGAVEISQGAFCASSPSRRHWSDAAGHQLHHLLNAIDGLPVDDVAATWVAVMPHAASLSTALADGLATALFTTSATQLRAHFPFECAILNANRAAAQSPNFPGGFFTH